MLVVGQGTLSEVIYTSGLSSVKNKPIKIMGRNKIVIGLLKIKHKTQTQYSQTQPIKYLFQVSASLFQRINVSCFGLKLFIFCFL